MTPEAHEERTRKHVGQVISLYRRAIVSQDEAVNSLLLDLTPENMAELITLLPEDLIGGLKKWVANAPTTDEGWEAVRVFLIGPGPDEETIAENRRHLRSVADGLRTVFRRNV
jgi:hypothetical protein